MTVSPRKFDEVKFWAYGGPQIRKVIEKLIIIS